jgi:hypothetical protein
MNISRRNFIASASSFGAFMAFGACCKKVPVKCSKMPEIAVQLYSIRNYIKNGILKAYESRRNIRSKDGQPQKALLIKGIELTKFINTY